MTDASLFVAIARATVIVLLATVISCFLGGTMAAEASNLNFSGTPVKSLGADGQWGDMLDAVAVDAGKGKRYSSAGEELTVFTVDFIPTTALKAIFDSKPGAFTPAQTKTLAEPSNPWIFRAIAERNTPNLLQIGNHKYIFAEFLEEQRIRVAPTGKNSMCMQAFKYEAHAFTLDHGKLVHISFVCSKMMDEKAPANANELELKKVSSKLKLALTSSIWNTRN